MIALAVAVVGIATWPAGTSARAATATPAWSVPLRMVLVTLTVVGLAALEPLLGVVLAGALASLPTILLVMTPAVHWSQGPADAVTLVWGTLVSITGTVVFLVVLVATAPALGLWPALALALLALPVGPAATRALASRLRRAGLLRGLVGVEVGVLAPPLHRQQLGVDPAGVRELGR
ncbi:hypothetical protein MM440_01010 [Arsenicicoccus piscis]|uniref:ABC transmembrane type-1 domain-containing protein n=1 Tax=Arsenicicoccus piscis TaxID=673954 RepID=A0ABQ6HRE6_9MICO|nr:hypothetical protein [Arsenicicoccus piscis]MCH8626400.1 hypothetical protein [Arsenicicoccus piscis]GMA21024.1 hypothetical protein GCM10025862_30450 [Arsenicicoccus piscis]